MAFYSHYLGSHLKNNKITVKSPFAGLHIITLASKIYIHNIDFGGKACIFGDRKCYYNKLKLLLDFKILVGEGGDGVVSSFMMTRLNTFMRLNFLDTKNYLAAAFSYDKYMKAYRY